MAEDNQTERNLKVWLDDLKRRDRGLWERLSKKLAEAERPAGVVALESVPLPTSKMVLETIVREGRPALLVQNNAMTKEDPAIDAAAQDVVDRLFSHADVLDTIIPLVGRIDVENFAGLNEYVGTGWLVQPDMVVTNRHVAELIARRGAAGFIFAAGRFGRPLIASIDYRHEYGVSETEKVKVTRILWIEPDQYGADIAFLEVERRSDGLVQDRILLAEADAAPDTHVAVVGYPARAPSSVIPDQAWMERLYNGHYDIKRIAPGLMGGQSQGWATHDCTTLGGNSGSVVLEMASGRAVALHFAGQYMVENYAVPASAIARYLKAPPWNGGDGSPAARPVEAPAVPGSAAAVTASAATSVAVPAGGGAASVTFNLPITVTVNVGHPLPVSAGSASAVPPLSEAIAALGAKGLGEGVHGVRDGLVVENGALRDVPCIVVAADPARLSEIAQRIPAVWQGYPVQVRPASLQDQLGEHEELVSEAPVRIAYDDDNRTGREFSSAWIEEPMELRCHVGPERSFEELKRFLGAARGELVSAMYQFYVDHIRAAIEERFTAKSVKMKLVLDPQTHDHGDAPPAGQFERSGTFRRWAQDFGFEHIYVPEGNGGFVSKAYHIKVTVRDRDGFWLSSGNWTKASQPLIPDADRLDPVKTGRAGNREWHVAGVSKTLAARLRAHILQDFETCGLLGGTLEAAGGEILVDVPIAALEAVVLEAAPSRVFEPLRVDRKVRVRPVLTPDGQMGGVYAEAVLGLIEGAQHKLLFQNQYITVGKATRGHLGDLVDALIAKARELDDVRIVLRSNGTDFWDSITELKRRGLDVVRCVRRLANTHTKGIIADDAQVLVGSQNWSPSALSVNRDASLLFDDAEIAEYYSQVFEVDWARASQLTDPAPAGPDARARIAEGPNPPPGFHRVPLASLLD
jgi:V8-like Glu-specific endopeptidase